MHNVLLICSYTLSYYKLLLIFNRLRRDEFAITEIELKAIASAAIIGLSKPIAAT